jgi:hypothetical protein
VNFLRRPLPRLVLWALMLVVVAVAAGVLGFDWWLILLVEFVAWALATLAERAIWDRTAPALGEPEVVHLRFLIVWLRQFADGAGELPADFDSLVRESFGDLIVG